MNNRLKTLFPRGFTLIEMMITMFISMVIFLLMGFVFIKMNSYYSEQFIREHVINYGNMAMVEINSLFKHANEISISNLQGISRIRFMNPDGSSDIVSVNRENGFFLNDIPMIGRTSSFGQSDVNYFNYDEDNKIEFKISSFDCDYVPANTGLSGKLSQTMYRLHLIIEVVKVVNGSEITTDFEFKKDIFAVIEYLS